MNDYDLGKLVGVSGEQGGARGWHEIGQIHRTFEAAIGCFFFVFKLCSTLRFKKRKEK